MCSYVMWTVLFITTTTHLFIVFSNFKFLTARRLPTLYWNSSNPLFTDRSRFPKDAEIGAGAAFIEVDAMDSMDIVCPTYSSRNSANKYEQLIIHQVSDLSFMSCELDSRSQAFLVCDSPLAPASISHKIVFRQYSPLPNGFEYQPGRSYYLITTSNGSAEGMNNTRYGLCVAANMRLRIDVRPLGDQSYSSPEEGMNARSTHESSKAERTKTGGRSRSSIVKSFTDDDAKSERETNGLNNESQKFAEKHGFDLTRLEYVRQLAIDGIEGDFSFRELENDSLRTSTDSTEKTLTSGPGRPRLSNSHGNRDEVLHSTSRQAQRWISKERQNRFGGPLEPFSDQDIDNTEVVQDYVVDDVTGGSTIFGRRNVPCVVIITMLLFWIPRR